MEVSGGRERLIVNCGASPPSAGPWLDAARTTAAHSTLVIGDMNSSELKPGGGLGRVPIVVDAQRQEANGAHWLEASHDGYRRLNGALHHRRLYMAESGEDIRGEDSVEGPSREGPSLEGSSPPPFAVRFHLHPTVVASVQQDGKSVVMRLPAGSVWTLRAKGAEITLEESVYLGAGEPRPTKQVVLTGTPEVQKAEWALTKAS